MFPFCNDISIIFCANRANIAIRKHFPTLEIEMEILWLQLFVVPVGIR